MIECVLYSNQYTHRVGDVVVSALATVYYSRRLGVTCLSETRLCRLRRTSGEVRST